MSYQPEGWDIEIDAGPISTSSRPQPNYVPAAPRRPEMPTAIMQPAPSATVDAWRPTPSIIEHSTPYERSKALMVRQILLWAIWLVLAVAAGLAAWQLTNIGGGYAALFGLIVFGICAAASFVALDRAERADSATGLERHRIDRAAELERLKLRQDHELKRMALDAYLDHLERSDT